MNDPFITALNTQKAALGWFSALAENMGNLYTPGYREVKTSFVDFVSGVQLQELPRSDDQGKSTPGKAPSNLFIEGKGYFTVRKPDGTLLYTRLGDFNFNADGTLVNSRGYALQGYLLGEDGNMVNTGDSNASPAANNPNHSVGGPGHIPTTEINLWIDPSNGKFFGKYDEYKVRSDGTVVGIADKGKVTTPLYRLAIVNFINPGALAQPEDQMFTPTEISGEPVEGSGEIRSGLLESSNVGMRENVSYLQQAKLQLDVTAKLISTNKNLLEEALRLIQ
ncbi:MAG TPA: flagellar hook-basal body complex protein [Oculatellaceae cyanobacterium]|jgi:flagellar hook protein FlgE